MHEFNERSGREPLDIIKMGQSQIQRHSILHCKQATVLWL